MLYNFAIGEIKINVENVKAVAWCIIAGIIVGLVVTFFNKTVTGALVRLLLKGGAIGEENSKSAADLGLLPDAPAIRAYRRSSTLQRVISAVGEGEDEKFFIPAENQKRAEEQYSLRGNELIVIIVGALALILLGTLLTIIL